MKTRHTNLSELPENAKLLAKVKAWDFSPEMRRFQKEYPNLHSRETPMGNTKISA
ncbi:hypothetical protein [Coleofasciculus sp. E2-BRE-01]|uniref:hypothetical protein n=1 Tax=Coleofasciculus sp. E2-BRE-01 TaxID=3069524 RepID=UPI0032FFD7BF